MIQIIVCRCTKTKLREPGVNFYCKQNFYQNIKDVCVLPCPGHPHFKDRFMRANFEMPCKYLSLKKGCCSNCATFYFTLNLNAEKIKVVSFSEVPSYVQLKKIVDYLEKDIKSLLFFYFYYKSMKVHCSFDNPNECHKIRGEIFLINFLFRQRKNV